MVRALRNVAGVAVVVLLAAAVNFLILRETLFTPAVNVPLIGAAAFGIVWFILWATTAARREIGRAHV